MSGYHTKFLCALILDFHHGMNVVFLLWGFGTVCEVNLLTFQRLLQVPLLNSDEGASSGVQNIISKFTFVYLFSNFSSLIIAETRNFSKYHTTSQRHKTLFLSSFMCWTNSTSSQCCTFLCFTWWNMNHHVSWVHPLDDHLDPSAAVIYMAVVSVLLMSRLVIHCLCYISRLLFLVAVSFSQHCHV
jgi:hypothetical protein